MSSGHEGPATVSLQQDHHDLTYMTLHTQLADRATYTSVKHVYNKRMGLQARASAEPSRQYMRA
jgi:hypothetical protein